MSANELPSTEELDEQIRVAAGRRSPFTIVGDWITLAGASPIAVMIYVILKGHVNAERGDQRAWPSRATLAELCSLKQARSVDPYIAELVKLGAIEVFQERYAGGMRRRNVYLVHEVPPESYAGHLSYQDYYAARLAKSAGGAPQRTTGRAGQTRKTAGQPVERPSAPPEGCSSAPGGGRPSTPELDVVELDEEEQTTTFSAENPAKASSDDVVDAELTEDAPIPVAGELFGAEVVAAAPVQPPAKKRGRQPKPVDPIASHASQLTRAWWDAREADAALAAEEGADPETLVRMRKMPTLPFPAVMKVVEAGLRANDSDEMCRRVLTWLVENDRAVHANWWPGARSEVVAEHYRALGQPVPTSLRTNRPTYRTAAEQREDALERGLSKLRQLGEQMAAGGTS